MAKLSWEKICERAFKNNKTLISEVERNRSGRFFNILCNECKNEMVLRADSFGRCNICNLFNRRFNNEKFSIKAKLVHGDKYNYDGICYVDCYTKIGIYCNTCKVVFYQRPCDHLYGNGCGVCAINASRSDTEEFILKSRIVHGDKYNYDGVVYINMKTKVEIKCNDCNNVFMQRPGDHLSGNGCPVCNESKGELRIAKYLSDKGIEFERQKEFEDLKHIKSLKFDFYLYGLNILAEYDGEGHYKPIFGSTPEEKQKNLEEQQIRDRLKDEWALVNNIILLRIPYWDFDRIEEILEAFIIEVIRKRENQQMVLEM